MTDSPQVPMEGKSICPAQHGTHRLTTLMGFGEEEEEEEKRKRSDESAGRGFCS